MSTIVLIALAETRCVREFAPRTTQSRRHTVEQFHCTTTTTKPNVCVCIVRVQNREAVTTAHRTTTTANIFTTRFLTVNINKCIWCAIARGATLYRRVVVVASFAHMFGCSRAQFASSFLLCCCLFARAQHNHLINI